MMRAADSFKVWFTEKGMRHLYFSNVGVKPAVGLDRITGKRFEQDFDDNVNSVLRKVGKGTYRFTGYRQMLLTKGKDSSPREICIPTVRDKLTITAISKILDDVYGEKCMTPQPQPVIDEVAKCLNSTGYGSFIKIDIAKFYASIDHETLLRIVRRKIRKREVLDLVSKAISTPSAPLGMKASCQRKTGVPEGLSISNKLANIYVCDLDAKLNTRDDCKYFRYVDDILILCEDKDLDPIRSEIACILKRLSLDLNEAKCHIGKFNCEAFSYLGYVFDGKKISVRKQSAFALERTLDGLIRKRNSYQSKKQWVWKLNFRITGCRITEDEEHFERFGWLHYFSRLNDMTLLYHFDWLIGRLFKRYGIEVPEELRSFHKAYYEIRYKADSTTYIPTFGVSTPQNTKREMLKEIFEAKNIDVMTDDQVDEIFNKKIRREAQDLERDIGLIS